LWLCKKINKELLNKIIVDEKVCTLEDLVKRRLSMIQDTKNLQDIMGLSLNEIQNMIIHSKSV
jgi:hypothetical protein